MTAPKLANVPFLDLTKHSADMRHRAIAEWVASVLESAGISGVHVDPLDKVFNSRSIVRVVVSQLGIFPLFHIWNNRAEGLEMNLLCAPKVQRIKISNTLTEDGQFKQKPFERQCAKIVQAFKDHERNYAARQRLIETDQRLKALGIPSAVAYGEYEKVRLTFDLSADEASLFSVRFAEITTMLKALREAPKSHKRVRITSS